MRISIALAFAAMLIACMTVPEPSTEGWVTIDEAARAGTVNVTPLEIIEDSRCPDGVQCIWAGRIVVRTRVASDGGRVQTLDLEDGEAARVPNGMLTLAEVRPMPAQDDEMAAADYRFRFSFAPDIMAPN